MWNSKSALLLGVAAVMGTMVSASGAEEHPLVGDPWERVGKELSRQPAKETVRKRSKKVVLPVRKGLSKDAELKPPTNRAE